MNYILGIDTGGTYTDSVIVDFNTKELIFKQKVLTTHRKLHSCIENSFKRIPYNYFKNIAMVSLSTTLATNSIIENRGCREGIILIGSKPNGRIPTDKYAVIHGKYDIKGRVQENIDPQEVLSVIDNFRGKVDAIAVSGYASVRNPAHEIYVKKIIESVLSIPVVCAHELSTELGYYERTVTAALNARLIPLTCDLILSVKSVMKDFRLNVPLMIVKGDGTLMTEMEALRKPIDTILSGPAASAIGAAYLSNEKNCFVLDIGGTTTDVINVTGGKTRIRNDGAKIGGWLTRVHAAEVFTTGLGGDSRICIGENGSILIGPEKSIPLSNAGQQYPDLINELTDIYKSKRFLNFLYNDYEAYIIQNQTSMDYSSEEKIVLDALKYSPHTLDYLIDSLSLSNIYTVVEKLTKKGVLNRISLTPTDILHVTREYQPWNTKIAELGANIFADRQNSNVQQFIFNIKKQISKRIDCALIQAAIYFDQQDIQFNSESFENYLVNKLFFQSASSNINISYQLKKKVIAIGAPAHVWMQYESKLFQTDIVIPENADTANAYGAAIGKYVKHLDILIRPDSTTEKYIVHSPLNRTAHNTLESATKYSIMIGKQYIEKLFSTHRFIYRFDIEDFTTTESSVDNLIERTIHFTAKLSL